MLGLMTSCRYLGCGVLKRAVSATPSTDTISRSLSSMLCDKRTEAWRFYTTTWLIPVSTPASSAYPQRTRLKRHFDGGKARTPRHVSAFGTTANSSVGTKLVGLGWAAEPAGL